MGQLFTAMLQPIPNLGGLTQQGCIVSYCSVGQEPGAGHGLVVLPLCGILLESPTQLQSTGSWAAGLERPGSLQPMSGSSGSSTWLSSLPVPVAELGFLQHDGLGVRLHGNRLIRESRSCWASSRVSSATFCGRWSCVCREGRNIND